VARLIQELWNDTPKKKDLELRVFKYLIAYAEFQFGDRVEGIPYQERGNGYRMDNWKVEIENSFCLYDCSTFAFETDGSISFIVCNDLVFPYYEKILDLLRPWSEYVDQNSTSLSNSLTGDHIDLILMLCSTMERKIAQVHTHRNHFDLAESHCQRALSQARLYEGEKEIKTDLLLLILRIYGELRHYQGNYDHAVVFAEEGCNCVAIANNPVKPDVQKAAGTPIEYLIHKGDLYNATLDSLKDIANKVDQQSDEAARGYFNLAIVIDKQE
jgi:hypothetical protein